MTSDEAVKNRASSLRSQASTHSAEAMCVLPVPTSPISTRSSRRSRNPSEARSAHPSPSGHETAGQSYPSNVFGAGSAQRRSSVARLEASLLARSASR